jgi:acetyl-CoA C-acetyltransferase
MRSEKRCDTYSAVKRWYRRTCCIGRVVKMTIVWILPGARTPIGRFLGELSHLTAPQLAGHAIRAALAASKIESDSIDEVILGQLLTSGVCQAPARQASILAGIPDSIGCATVGKVCGSGLYAIMLADRSIRAGDNAIVVAGGMESMSQAPHLLRGGRAGWKYGQQPLLDAIEQDGLLCPHGNSLMGVYAENVARSHAIDRRAQDEWAMQSHQRAIAAQRAGAFATEIAPVPTLKAEFVQLDGGPREDSSMDKLAKLRPAFDSNGTVTAGNASTLSDGAAAVVVLSDAAYRTLGRPPAFRIVASAVFANKPQDLFLAPVGAIEMLLRKTGRKIEDVDLFEINEAFASQTVACMRDLEIPLERLNVNGGALALGHPIGCSGGRVLVTLMHALHARGLSVGVASLCLGGGEAVAIMIESN